MSWLVLFFAGILEVFWATGLKYTQGFTKPIPSLFTFVAIVSSLYLLSIALRSLPLGVAYAIWVAIGIVGAVVVGVVLFNEPLSLFKIISLVLILLGVLGLKLSTSAS